MTTSGSGVGRTEAIGASHIVAAPIAAEATPMTALFAELDKISSAVGRLESRMDDNDRRLGDPLGPSRPPPAPPFSAAASFPFSFPLPQPPLTTTMTAPQVTTPTSSPWIRSSTWPPHPLDQQLPSPFQSYAAAASLPTNLSQQTVGPTYSISPIRFSEPSIALHNQPLGNPWLQDNLGMNMPSHTPLPRPQLINPYSCWGPPHMRQQFGQPSQDQHSSKVRMEPPRFDGSDANNWIRCTVLLRSCGDTRVSSPSLCGNAIRTERGRLDLELLFESRACYVV